MSDIDHNLTDEAVCPHCGYERGDSWELGAATRNDCSDSGEAECEECGKPFRWEREVSITYSTSALPEKTTLSGGNTR